MVSQSLFLSFLTYVQAYRLVIAGTQEYATHLKYIEGTYYNHNLFLLLLRQHYIVNINKIPTYSVLLLINNIALS